MNNLPILLTLLFIGLAGCDSKPMDSNAKEVGSGEDKLSGPVQADFAAKIGDRFPTFNAVSMEGSDVVVGPESYGEKATLIVFWSTWCGFCMSDLPHEIELANRFESKGLRVIGINADDNLDVAKVAIFEKAIPWRNFYEGKEHSISTQLKIASWPALFLLDKSGKIVETTDMLRRTSFRKMPDGTVQPFLRLDTSIDTILGQDNQ